MARIRVPGVAEGGHASDNDPMARGTVAGKRGNGRKDFGIDGNSFGIDRDSLGIDRDSIDIDRNSIGIDRNSFGVDRNSFGIDRDSFGIDRNSFGIDGNSFGIDRNSIGIDRNSFGVDGNSFGIDGNSFGIDGEDSGIDARASAIAAEHAGTNPGTSCHILSRAPQSHPVSILAWHRNATVRTATRRRWCRIRLGFCAKVSVSGPTMECESARPHWRRTRDQRTVACQTDRASSLS